MTRGLEDSLLALQCFQVAFLLLHDWIPLGRLNDIAAIRSTDTSRKILLATLISGTAFVLGFAFSLYYYGQAYPDWVRGWLWVSYGLLFLGELRAWWIPYLLHPEPDRAARYEALFGRTHHFLPYRNGMVPNTLHVILHLATLITLVLLTRI
jgi:hypothetical protein